MYDNGFKAKIVFEYLCSGKKYNLINKKYSIPKKQVLEWEKQFYNKPAFRNAVMNGRQLVHLLHIGKTGGTALDEAINSNPLSDKYLICKRGHGTKLRHIPKGDKVVFVLRDPVKRFISSFYSRESQGMPRYFGEWNSCEKLAFKQFTTPNSLGRALLSEDELIHSAAECAMASINHVKTSFFDWFDSVEYFEKRRSDILFVGYQETLNEDFESLKSIIGLEENICLPQDSKKAHISNPDEDKHMDKDVVERIKEWYQRDYEFLEYCKKELK